MRILCFGLVFLVLLLVAPFHLHAEERENVALLSIDVVNERSDVRAELAAHIALGLAKHADVLGLGRSQRELENKPHCFSRDCLQRIGEALSVHRFVRGLLTANGAHYSLKLELFQVGDEPFLQNTVTIMCAICTIAELAERSEQAAERLLRVTSTKSASITILSIPSGGIISIDGLEAGLSPVVAELVPGPHQIAARKEGYAVHKKTIEVKPGSDESQRFDLPLRSLAPTERNSENYGYWKWASAAGAGILLTAGTTLVVVDGDPRCNAGEGRCASSHNTMTAGIIALSGSLVAGAAAAWMFWDDSKNTTKPRAALQWIPGGATAGITLDF